MVPVFVRVSLLDEEVDIEEVSGEYRGIDVLGDDVGCVWLFDDVENLRLVIRVDAVGPLNCLLFDSVVTYLYTCLLFYVDRVTGDQCHGVGLL